MKSEYFPEDNVRTLTLILIALFLTVCCIACAPKGKDAPQPDAKAPEAGKVDNVTPAIPPTDMAGADATAMPGTMVGDAAGSTTTSFDDTDLRAFIKAVVMEDREGIKALVTDDLAAKVDDIIKDLGFSEFVEGGDYKALWEKVDKAGSLSVTGIGGSVGLGLWQVSGKASGLKDLMVEFHLKVDDSGTKVSSYTMTSP